MTVLDISIKCYVYQRIHVNGPRERLGSMAERLSKNDEENGVMDKGTHTNCQRPQAHRRNKVFWAFDFGAAKRSHHATVGACASSAYPRLGV
ncbi:hypothetical protein HZ326_11062 [Fusarium oxysporum f. sp. albedinis]|nr:hypothetical protein HZ326_11062 [Fusarium oxysporum f. sp. albedinis]